MQIHTKQCVNSVVLKWSANVEYLPDQLVPPAPVSLLAKPPKLLPCVMILYYQHIPQHSPDWPEGDSVALSDLKQNLVTRLWLVSFVSRDIDTGLWLVSTVSRD